MKRVSLIRLLAALALLPTQPLQAQTELVANGSLDSFDGSGLATSWNRWWEEVPNPNTGSLDWAGKPDWSPESNPALVLGGQSQHIGATWNPWHAGIYQTITAPPNAQLRITASGRAFASNDNFPTPSDGSVPVRMQLGADPNGGADWWSGNVQWSGQGSPHDTWQTFTLEVTAGASGKVTIFLSANYRGNSRLHLDVWWDNVSAQVLNTAPTATNTTVPATAAPTSSVANPTATSIPPTPSVADTATQPAPTPEPTLTLLPPTAAPAQPASACVTVFEDANGNGVRDTNEAIIPNSTVTLDGQTSTGNPYCFESLAPGAYTLTASLPQGYFSTTGDQLTLNLASGQTAEVQFGAQSSRLSAPPATAAPAPSESSSVLPVVIGVIVVLLLGIGAAAGVVFWRLRR